MKRLRRTIPITLALLLVSFMMGPAMSMAYDINVDLKTADSFAVLAGSTITNTGTTFIDGDVGLDPGSAFTGQDTATITGSVHINDSIAQVAKVDLEAAYIDAEGRDSQTIGAELGGETLTSGVYSSDTSFQITGTLTLDGEGDPNSVFIFQTGSTLTTATDSNIELINGANCDNIFWQVGSSATLGVNSQFAGNILARESITANNGAEIQGSLLALDAAVTLENNQITQCSATTGSLTVTKVVSGDTGDMTLPAFEITVAGPGEFTETWAFADGESYTWDGLVPGEYTITESSTELGDEWTVEGEGAVQVSAGENRTATITNVYTMASDTTPVDPEYGSLTVKAVVTGDTDDVTIPAIEFTITGPDDFTETMELEPDGSYTWDELAPGEYTITVDRTDLSSGWIVTGEGTVQITADQSETVTITYHYEPIEPIPQTGQLRDFNTTIFLVTAAAMLAGAGTFLAFRRKKRYE